MHIFKGIRAHPRSRGEHARRACEVASQPGSSPLARGTRDDLLTNVTTHGLIPARAGNTPGSCMARRWSRAHPRSRGEHTHISLYCSGVQGSSPLARGTLELVRAHGNHRGLIPARAGNTPKIHSKIHPAGAHPRSRGEHVEQLHGVRLFQGSSPLARGTLAKMRAVAALVGLIPARAGNTSETPTRKRVRGAHPRSRGEHSVVILGCLGVSWLIPARAGNTLEDPQRALQFGAHPRSRGEH